MRQRTGFRYNPGKSDAIEQGPFNVDDNYLQDLAENQFRDSLMVTHPKTLSHFETHKEALDWIYGMEVGLPQLDSGKKKAADKAGTLLEAKIAEAGFPLTCYKKIYEFDLGHPPSVRFPNVFLRDGKPHAALFAVSLSAPNLLNTVKARLCEVHAIREWSGLRPGFAMCTPQTRSQADKGKSAILSSLGLLDKWGVEAVYADGIDGKLREIRRAVSPLDVVRH